MVASLARDFREDVEERKVGRNGKMTVACRKEESISPQPPFFPFPLLTHPHLQKPEERITSLHILAGHAATTPASLWLLLAWTWAPLYLPTSPTYLLAPGAWSMQASLPLEMYQWDKGGRNEPRKHSSSHRRCSSLGKRTTTHMRTHPFSPQPTHNTALLRRPTETKPASQNSSSRI